MKSGERVWIECKPAQDIFLWRDFVITVMANLCFISIIKIFLANQKEKSRKFTTAILTNCGALCRFSVCESSVREIPLLLDSLEVFLLLVLLKFRLILSTTCRSQWPRGLRRRSSAARLLRLWVPIPPGGMDVCCECCVVR
jgi:hypothetical protein